MTIRPRPPSDPPPLAELLDGAPCPTWLQEAYEELGRHPDAWRRIGAPGLVLRHWRSGPDARAWIADGHGDALAGLIHRVRGFIRRLPTDAFVAADVEAAQACDRAVDLLEAAVQAYNDGGIDEPIPVIDVEANRIRDAAENLKFVVTHRTDELAGWQGTCLRGALEKLDRHGEEIRRLVSTRNDPAFTAAPSGKAARADRELRPWWAIED